MKTQIEHNNINRLLSKKLGLRILGIVLLSLFIGNSVIAQTSGCPIKKQNGSSCYSTTLKSVTQNANGYTITLLVEVTNASGGAGGTGCQALSHFAVQAESGTYSNISWAKVTGNVSFTGIDMGNNIGNGQSFNNGFKLTGPSNFGDNHEGSFTVTYTLTKLQDQTFATKAGNYSNDAVFTTDDFTKVLNCSSLTGPTAVDDATTTPVNTPVDINVLDNDTQGSGAIDPTKVTLGTQPGTSVGVFTVNNTTGVVTFTPAKDYTGIATISYQIVDANNLTSNATIKVTISAGSSNNFPATGFGTLAFEDLWPYKGDYDMNDLVLDYKFDISSNTSNYVDKVVGTFVIKAFGASMENGFGFQLPGIANASDLTVSGYSLKENFIKLGSNGTELGQDKPTIIVYDNAFKQMTTPGGIGVNTDPNQPYVTPKTITVTINFKPNTYTLNDLDIANFNPFLIVNKVRGVEVHLPDYAPTTLADKSLLGTGDDNSSAANNRYYKTANNLPWAINTYGRFDYPVEKADISQTHLHFAAWATSGGMSFSDWYKDLTGYRNISLVYQIPQ